MPHRQSSLIEGRIFHYKVPFPLNFTSWRRSYRSSRPEVFYKKGVFRNFAKFTAKQVFSCEFGKTSKNTFFHKTPPMAASDRTVG